MDNNDPLFGFLDSAEASDVGQRRNRNEDAVARIPESGVFCIADGMGGGDSGDIASRLTVNKVTGAINSLTDRNDMISAEKKCQVLNLALKDAGRLIRKRAIKRGRGICGSTAVTLAFDAFFPVSAVALHAGDSRIYRLRKETLTRITRDHSVAEESGLSKKQLPGMLRNMITRAVGISETLQLERTDVDVLNGDLFLLCSDGLNSMLSDKEIQRLLIKSKQAQLSDLALDLIAAANNEGGEDNISVILVKIGVPPLPPETEKG